jgi:hypothetical protein
VKLVLRVLIGMAAALAAGAALAVPPQRVILEYDMSYNDTAMAQAVETLEHDGKRYKLSAEVKAKGVFAMVRSGAARRASVGDVTPAGLRPNEYRDKRGDQVERVARFDWTKGVLHQGEEAKSEEQPMPQAPGMMLSDRLSFMWTFAFHPPSGKEVQALLTDGRGLSSFRYAISGTEVLRTAAGDIETMKLTKLKDPGDQRGTEIWLATKRHFLPVRILVTEKDGTRIDQVVRRIGA